MRDGVVHAEADFISGVPPEAVSAHRVQWAQHAARVAAAVTARRRCEEAALYIVPSHRRCLRLRGRFEACARNARELYIRRRTRACDTSATRPKMLR